MDRAQLPLNALRAFEAAARHLNFTRAAIELCVSQGAVSHHVAQLERRLGVRSEEHTSELQSLMRISYAVFCLQKKKIHTITTTNHIRNMTQHNHDTL